MFADDSSIPPLLPPPILPPPRTLALAFIEERVAAPPARSSVDAQGRRFVRLHQIRVEHYNFAVVAQGNSSTSAAEAEAESFCDTD